MRLASDIHPAPPLPNPSQSEEGSSLERYADYKVIRRNGAVVGFEPDKIAVAVTKAFLAVAGGTAAASAGVREKVQAVTQAVVAALVRRHPSGGTFHIEDIQDQVELALMRAGEHQVARSYVLYREERARERAARVQEAAEARQPKLHVTVNGAKVPLDLAALEALVQSACQALGDAVDPRKIVDATLRDLYDGVPLEEAHKCAILAARMLIESDPAYTYVSARLLLHTIRREVLGEEVAHEQMATRYAEYFPAFIQQGIKAQLLDEKLGTFDLKRLGEALDASRDLKFDYLGLQTLYDRYFLHIQDHHIELPQAFFMRVAMGLSINEVDREARAIEFYNVLSTFDFMSSTPTLFNSGTQRSQLSSCYLTTVPDDLDGIYEAIKENALLSKFAGGLGNDWTPVRALGAYIKGTNGKSQGIIPFLKVVSDTAVAVNQCFAPHTAIYTALGLKEIKDVKPGDLVLGKSGQYREVERRFVYNQDGPMVSVRVRHGIDPLLVTAGHPFYAIKGVPLPHKNRVTYEWLEKGKIKPEWIEAGQLEAGDYVAQVVPKEVVNVAGLTEDDARMYGILLGDGHCGEREWTVVGNPHKDVHLEFVRNYLEARGIHFWESQPVENACRIGWATGTGLSREATTGRVIGSLGQSMPFNHEDLYDEAGCKRIALRFCHLPRGHTLALIRGLLETDGCVSRGRYIHFTNSSRPLIDGLRYQLLRMGIPASASYIERKHEARDTVRADGTKSAFGERIQKVYEMHIPAVKEIAEPLGCAPIQKKHWLEVEGKLFSRVMEVRSIEPKPFVFDLKVEADESYMTESGLAHNGGKRKGAVCCYLETWHLDIEEFLELRKNTGDDRRRTHDMNTANWIPDLFMKRVMEGGEWTLFSPSDCPDLHDKYGSAFEEAYVRYEEKAARGELKLFRKLPALTLWRKMISMLFETGHPWITFKDPCNVRSPQQHVGVVHSSNLCSEITLNTNATEIAVCNLGSVNLVAHLKDDGQGGKTLDHEKLKRTIHTAMRMLDNVIDINYYAVKKARDSNYRHRPVGLGIMGFQDALQELRVPYASEAAVEFADRSMEAVCYYAYWASTELAEERGRYSSYAGSLWDKGILPQDTLKLLLEQRGGYVDVDTSESMDWASLRKRIAAHGMRNSNCVAIAPTATISNIIGVSASIEPNYQNLYVKSNLSGEFTVVNEHLVKDLKKLGLWDNVMVADLKHFDGSIGKIDRVPQELRDLYATAFEVETKWIVEAAARRQKWIDQAQSLNIYMAGASGKKLDETYKLAWLRGLKTTYYLRTLAATSAEKSTGKGGELNAVPAHGGMAALGSGAGEGAAEAAGKFCSIDNPDCEACQ
jgi:ribonucleoside-diphosphate reductase alpha chain